MANEVIINVKAKDVNATQTFNKIEGGAKKSSAGVKAAWGLAGGAVGKFIGDTIMKSSDLNETMNKSQVIFGKHAGEMTKWASGAAENLGMSKNAALQASSGFALMFQQLGSTGSESVKLSKNVVQLATDLGSFHNLDTADVMERISAAFRGEYDSLQQLVPTINAARVQKEALAMTGKKNAKALTDEEKAMAALKIITEESESAQGDFKETSDGLANTIKTLKARFEDWQSTAAGEDTLAQLAEDATTAMDAFLELTEALETVGDGLETLKAGSGGGLSEFGDEIIGLKAKVTGAFATMLEAAAKWNPALRDNAKAARELADKAEEEFKRVRDGWEQTQKEINAREVRPKLKADKKDAQAKLDSINAQLKKTHGKEARAKLKADKAAAEANIRRINALLNQLHGKTAVTWIRTNRMTYYGTSGVPTNPKGDGPRASGGYIGGQHAAGGGMRGGQVMVGEGGPEIVDLPLGSHVNSNPDSRRMMATQDGSGGDTHFHFHGPVYGDHNALRRALVNMKRSGQLDVVLR